VLAELAFRFSTPDAVRTARFEATWLERQVGRAEEHASAGQVVADVHVDGKKRGLTQALLISDCLSRLSAFPSIRPEGQERASNVRTTQPLRGAPILTQP
jgi:hypothetical protein